MSRPPPPAGPAPDCASLRQAALAYLSRYAATEAGLLRVLLRRVDRWARRAEAEGVEPGHFAAQGRAAAREVALAMAATGAVNDKAFAESRARNLARAGRSRRAVAAHLAARGVDAQVVRDALPDDAAELAAAVLYARRRRLGPFRAAPDPTLRPKDLGAMARAGFQQPVAEHVLRLDPDTARNLADHARRGV